MGSPAANDVLDVWERLNLVDLTDDRHSTLADHPDTQALSQMPYALVLEAAHLAREGNHHRQLRLREWLNCAVALAADDARSTPPLRSVRGSTGLGAENGGALPHLGADGGRGAADGDAEAALV